MEREHRRNVGKRNNNSVIAIGEIVTVMTEKQVSSKMLEIGKGGGSYQGYRW